VGLVIFSLLLVDARQCIVFYYENPVCQILRTLIQFVWRTYQEPLCFWIVLVKSRDKLSWCPSGGCVFIIFKIWYVVDSLSDVGVVCEGCGLSLLLFSPLINGSNSNGRWQFGQGIRRLAMLWGMCLRWHIFLSVWSCVGISVVLMNYGL